MTMKIMQNNGAVKVVALYFPQLHAIPENDQWWGKGFTDWVNVKRAKPLFPGHRQPRTPLNRDYYDQSDPKVIRRQVAMAREYGISAFSHYHYWFNGKQLLQTPTNLFLEMKDLDIEFCLSWANETWSRRWDGQEDQILIQQEHPPTKEAWGRHFEYLIKAWTDRRALRIGDKPLFCIYRPDKIPELRNMLDYWRERAREYGIEDMHFMSVVQYRVPQWETLRHFDSVFLFQPFVAYYNICDETPWPWWRAKLWPITRHMSKLPYRYRVRLQTMLERAQGPTSIDYDQVWQRLIDMKIDRAIKTYHGAFVDWDNTARYGERAKVWRGATPQRFEHWMGKLVDKVSKQAPDERLIFINAWNEWAEGAYLEPDIENQYSYLEAIRRVTQAQQRPRIVQSLNSIPAVE
jgi:lipopolysaccharide biosynthesis protein